MFQYMKEEDNLIVVFLLVSTVIICYNALYLLFIYVFTYFSTCNSSSKTHDQSVK